MEEDMKKTSARWVLARNEIGCKALKWEVFFVIVQKWLAPDKDSFGLL